MHGLRWRLYIIKLTIRDILSFFVFLIIFAKNKISRDRNDGIRILVYHSIRNIPKNKDALRITVPPKLFERQIKYLLAKSYEIVSMDDFLDYMSGVKNIEGKKIVLTFDDGFEDNFDCSYPILKTNRLTSTYFLATDYIDSENTFPWYGSNSLYGKPLTWAKVSRLLSEGMTIGSHTCTHQNLGNLTSDGDKLEEEIKASKQILEDKLKFTVRYFAYPFGCKGSYNRITQDCLRKSGYKAACVNIFGLNRKNDSRFELKRTRIDWNDTLLKFKMKLAGAYDWIDRF